MMRVALVGLWQAGVQVDAVIHDAFLIEARADRITDTVTVAQQVMAEASRRVLRGVLTLRSDAQVDPAGGPVPAEYRGRHLGLGARAPRPPGGPPWCVTRKPEGSRWCVTMVAHT